MADLLTKENKRDAGEGPDDPALLAAISAGDQVAFTRLVHRYTGLLFSLAWRISGQKEAAEEIVQESFLRVWQHAGRWDAAKGASVKTWLYRIATNQAIDWRRKKRAPAAPPDIVIVDESQDSARLARERLCQDIIGRALQKLPERQRIALVLFHYEELSVEQTAGILGTSRKGVENLLFRARRALKKTLSEDKKLSLEDLL